MQVKLTIGERLKDLRVERKLTLEQLAAEVSISKSALGKYESDNGKDISPYSILLLADYYGVSCDYLMGRTETKNHPNTALHELHLSDASIDILKTGKFNHRLLSELICHKDFQRFMLDAEIYVDRIADMRVNDMNAVLEAVRQMALMKNGGEENRCFPIRVLKANIANFICFVSSCNWKNLFFSIVSVKSSKVAFPLTSITIMQSFGSTRKMSPAS